MSASDWHPAAAATLADPVGAQADLRARCPVAWSDDWGGFWALTRYDDIVAAAMDPDVFSSAGNVGIPRSTSDGAAARPPLETDRPEHTFWRRALAPYFKATIMAGHEPRFRAIVAGMVDHLIALGEADAFAELTYPLPVNVLCAVLDLPPADWPQIKDWTEAIIAAAVAQDAGGLQAANTAMNDYIRGVLAERRAQPRDPEQDVITGLCRAEDDGAPVADERIVATVRLLLAAGHNTTTHAMGSAIVHLARNPDDQRRLREQPELIPAAVEEVVRMWTPIQALGRFVRRDVEIGGRTLRAGDRVALVWSSGNRDAARFERPDECVIDRGARHIGFGQGIHLCLGAPMARLELRLLLEELLARTSSIALAGDVVEGRWPSIGPRRVPVRLEAAR
jgi:cytochrome P450